MKKIISFILCVLFLVGIAIPAFATDVSKIEPDGPVTIVIGEFTPYPTGTRVVQTVHGDTTIIYTEPYRLTYEEETIVVNTNNNTTTNETTLTPEEQKTGTTTETAPIDMTEHTEAEYDLIDAIYQLVNEERKKAGVQELYYDFDIQAAADLRAKECATLFDHTRPDGTSCFTVVEDVDYKVVGENLLKADQPIATAEQMMKSWMESEGHRHNILLADFKSVTIGIYEKDNVVYASQIFLG